MCVDDTGLYNSSEPYSCFRGTYCPEGTANPIMCPLGYQAVPETNFTRSLLSSVSSACVACEPGFYGSDPARLECGVCPPGYVCLGATTKEHPVSVQEDRGYLCPRGHYCPRGSSRAIACPRGMYQPLEGQSNSSACLPCAANFYQDQEGSDSCKAVY